jgi:hypothetical protein
MIDDDSNKDLSMLSIIPEGEHELKFVTFHDVIDITHESDDETTEGSQVRKISYEGKFFHFSVIFLQIVLNIS